MRDLADTAGEVDKEPPDEGLSQFVRFYNLESREEGILWDTKPSYVIMYDPDMAFIRQLEVMTPTHPCLWPSIAHLQAMTSSCYSALILCMAVLSCRVLALQRVCVRN